LNLFIASELNWQNKKIKIRQETNFPDEEQTKLTITNGSARFKLMIRYPYWVSDGALKVLVNGKNILVTTHPSSYVCIERKWKKGDVVVVKLPMHNRIEHLPNVPNYIAFMHGPILLSAKTGTEDLRGLMADDSRWGHIAGGKKLPLNKAPIIVEDDVNSLVNKIIPVAGKPFTFTFAPEVKIINAAHLVLEPFYKIHDARYEMYWMILSSNGYRSYLDSLSNLEQQKIELQKRTIDFVAPGEQQPEADHFIQKENSNTGNKFDEFWRDASNGGFFSYKMSTNAETDLSLIVRYCGAEPGGRKFDIYIDDEKLLTEDNTGRWIQAKFQELEYTIPNAMIKGKTNIRVKFIALPGNVAGGVFYIRLVRKKI